MRGGAVLVLMATLFLTFGYMGVPVSFALIAGVLAFYFHRGLIEVVATMAVLGIAVRLLLGA